MFSYPDDFLIVPEAAAELRMAKRTLDNHRWKGTGPKFRRHGGRIVYRRGDLLAWSEERAAWMAEWKRGRSQPTASASHSDLCAVGPGLAQGDSREAILERESKRPNWPLHVDKSGADKGATRTHPSP